jgi:hypothetical protein
MNLIKIAFFTLVALMTLFFSFKIGGLSSSYTPYDPPLLKAPQPWIILQFPESFDKQETLQSLLSTQNNFWIGLEVRLCKDGTFYAASTAFLKAHSMNNLLSLTSTQIEQMNSIGNLQKVEDIIAKYSKQNFVLFIKDDQKEIDLRLQAFLTRTKASDRILIDSEYDNVLTSLKELHPLGLFGSGIGERTRMLMMSGLYIESISSLKGDAWITPLYQGKAPLLNQHLRAELSRRYIPLIIGPINNANEYQEAKKFTPNGYILSTLELIK